MKGHAGNPSKEAADRLSKMATEKQRENVTRTAKESVLTRMKSNLPSKQTDNRKSSATTETQEERQLEHISRESQEAMAESKNVDSSIKPVDKREGSSASAGIQTYPSKLEIHQKELLKAFKLVEAQVLKIVEQSHIDQNDNEKSRLQTENLWLRDKIKDLEKNVENREKRKRKTTTGN